MRLLIITEKSAGDAPVASRQATLFKRDIHVPPALVGVLAGLFLITLFMMDLGWSWKMLGGVSAFVILSLAFFTFYLRHDFPRMLEDDEAVMLLGTLAALFTAVINAMAHWPLARFLTPIPAAAILATLLLHPRVAAALCVLLVLAFGVMQGFSFDWAFLAFFSSMGAVAASMSVRTHKDLVRVGGVTAVVGVAALLILQLFHNWSWRDTLTHAGWTALNGFLSAVLASGLLPFLESFFLRITPMKLLEVADFNQPLLKRLMVEAPGTYHHSLMMATLAESAANAIGANALLCRVGAYYHDIGKLVKPEYFIENQGQTGGHNPHGNLAPALSSLVVISHVKEGVALARQAKLPQEIIDFIPMHHGTSRIEYFYRQAKEDAEEDYLKNPDHVDPEDLDVAEQTYRYPGPKPVTRETAILMMADSVEAAARTIEEPSHPRFDDLVKKIIRGKFEDGQLNRSPLTLSDLSKIQEAFVNTLTSIYHARIEYPEEERSR